MATKTDDFTCLLAWERFNDYVLMNVLDGSFDASVYAKAASAFDLNDTKLMKSLADSLERDVSFIEADVLFADLEKPKTKDGKSREWSTGERHAILRETEGTRAYARVKLDAMMETPFS